MKKIFTTLLILLTLGFAAGAIGQSDWIGTGWVTGGATISSSNLKSNVDYLFNQKAPIPGECNGETEFLGWFNGGWVCNEPQTPQNCTFAGATISNGESATAYAESSPAFGGSCQSEVRTCSNGTLSGTYQSASCSISEPGVCVLGSETLAHGETITAYANISVPAGESCQSEVRTCSNGTLSGSYPNTTCVISDTACTFHGTDLGVGGSVTAYRESSVPFGSTCTSQARECQPIGSESTTISTETCTPVDWDIDIFIGGGFDNPGAGSTSACDNYNLHEVLCGVAGTDTSNCVIKDLERYRDTVAYCGVRANVCRTETATTPGEETGEYALTGFYEHASCTVDSAPTVAFNKSEFFNEVPQAGSGFFGLFNTTSYVFAGDWGITSSRSDGENGYSSSQQLNYRDLAADPASLSALCALKGYSEVVSAPTTASVSAGTNLLFGTNGTSWGVRPASGAVRFNGGSLVCGGTNTGALAAQNQSQAQTNTNSTVDTNASTGSQSTQDLPVEAFSIVDETESLGNAGATTGGAEDSQSVLGGGGLGSLLSNLFNSF